MSSAAFAMLANFWSFRKKLGKKFETMHNCYATLKKDSENMYADKYFEINVHFM